MTLSSQTVTRQAGTSNTARRRSRRRPSVSHVLIALAAVAAFTLNFFALKDRDETVLVAVADQPLSIGAPLSAGDVRFVPLESGFAAIDTLLREPALASRQGWVLDRSIEEGELVAISDLIQPGASDGLRSMSVPVDVEHAAGGAVVVGDRVDVITVRDGAPSYVVANVEVISVPAESGSSLGGFAAYHLVVAVDEEEALRLAAALDSGSLEVVRSTGAEPARVGEVVDDS